MEDGSFNTVHGEIDTQLFIRNNPTAVVVDASKGYVPEEMFRFMAGTSRPAQP